MHSPLMSYQCISHREHNDIRKTSLSSFKAVLHSNDKGPFRFIEGGSNSLVVSDHKVDPL